MYQGDELYNEVFSFVQKLEIIDTHEHLPGFEKRRNPDADVLSEYLGDYIGTDLQSAGLPEKDFIRACDTSIPIMERYRLLEPYWEACRFTGYGRGVDETVRLVCMARMELTPLLLSGSTTSLRLRWQPAGSTAKCSKIFQKSK